MSNKILLSGDEAIARGVWEAGCAVAAAYPGTPSTEILEAIGKHYKEDIYCQWACNEKVALEIAVGAAIGGARSFAAMKHVGLNVAADPLLSIAYGGVNGGLVVVTADDPGCHSSQNEQDNRLYAPLSRLIMLEPSDSQECLDFTREAFRLSEKYDTPVLLRVTTRVCHSRGAVILGERTEDAVKKYVEVPAKYALLPVNARTRHVERERQLQLAAQYAEETSLNACEKSNAELGIITSGICYQHVREVWPEASVLKLGLTHPLPDKLIASFAQSVDKLIVIEEGEPYLENHVKSLDIQCSGKELTTRLGELSAARLRRAFGLEGGTSAYASETACAPRPPVLCAGCPHRGFFHALKKHKKDIVAIGDIGCYALGVSPPLEGFGVVICMGSGFSAPIGMAQALQKQGDTRKVFGILGDSTFFHSGMNSLLDVIHAGANVCACVLDNSITAMTGHQENPGTARDLMGQAVPAARIEDVVRSFGLSNDRICIVDPIDQKAMGAAIQAALSVNGPFVIIARSPCILLPEVRVSWAGKSVSVDDAKCTGCKACMRIGCPSLSFTEGKAEVADTANCTACGLCAQMCKFGAIGEVRA